MKKRKTILPPLTLAIALLSCATIPEKVGNTPASTPTESAIASLILTGTPSALEIGKPVSLTVTARNSAGQVIPGKTYLWTSSDPAVATVDAGGIVNARRLGDATISVKTDDRVAVTDKLSTYGLEVAGGTNLLAAGTLGVTKETVGTITAIRIRDLNGNKPIGSGTGQITGPSGWNNNNQYAFTAPSPESSYSSTLPAVTGLYKISLTFAGVVYDSSFWIDSNKRINYPTGISMTSVKLDSITGSWNPVQGAVGYYAGDCAKPIGWVGNVASATIAISPTYVKGERHAFCVSTKDYDFNQRFPDQVNSARNSVEFIVP
jgi:hypothetical protein